MLPSAKVLEKKKKKKGEKIKKQKCSKNKDQGWRKE